MDEEEIIYQQEQVVWAKIRGYPWWPAFVSEIQQVHGKDSIYVVVFFGDNTNSRLDHSKLRKFIDNYTQCYSKAKNQRKLMNSIMMAEEKLRQNDQNVEIFEELRNKIKGKKGKSKTKENYEQLSNNSDQGQAVQSKKNNQNQIYEEHDQSIVNSKNQDKSNSKPVSREKNSERKTRRKAKIQEEPVFEQKDYNGEQVEKSDTKPRDRRREKRQSSQKNKISIMRQVDIVIDLTKKMNSESKQHKQSIQQIQIIKQQINAESLKPQSVQIRQEQPADSNCIDKLSQAKNKRGSRRSSKKKSDRKRNKRIQPNIVQENHASNSQQKIQQEQIKGEKNISPENFEIIILPAQLVKQATEPLPKHQKSQIIEIQGEQPEQQAQDSQQLSSDIIAVKRRGRSVSTGHPITSIRPVAHPRKRGRPKKIDIAKQPEDDQESQRENKAQNGNVAAGPKTKFIRKSFAPLKQPERPKGLSIADQTVINGVKKLLHNRSALIEFLLHSSINVDNVKQILDMDVSNILQEGIVTEQVIHLLEIFRAALLYKYFPDDVKHRKKYEKLLKKKHINRKQDEREKSNEKPELRKKTMLKIKKFITNSHDSESKTKDVSQKIEELIYRTDESLGNQYCKVAFQVLTALKEKAQTYHQIIRKLECKTYD